jgi:hypothetical protein
MSIGIGNEQQFDAFHNSSLPLEILSRDLVRNDGL